jgi:hypothetical protein|tara:strand:+ start:191 stop:787 length:597 start_codon:yes stop_codon:yes gene_type:complete
MFKIKDMSITPPPGWNYFIPETKVEVEADDYEELIDMIYYNYHINKIEPPMNLEELVHHDICIKSPTGICNKENRLAFNITDLINGTIAFAIMMRKGKGAFVDQKEAERRASICSKCPLNVQNPACYSCLGFESVIKKVQKGRNTSKDSELKVCGVCKCFTKALVHVDIDIIKATTKAKHAKLYPSGCWKKEIIEGVK